MSRLREEKRDDDDDDGNGGGMTKNRSTVVVITITDFHCSLETTLRKHVLIILPLFHYLLVILY